MAAKLNKTRLREIARDIRVTDFSDYGSCLAAIYSKAKSEDNSFSYTRYSDSLGIGSSNAHSIINGKRPLTAKAAERICVALNLTGIDKKYFLALVIQERATGVAERDAAFRQRLELRRGQLPTELSKNQLLFFENWHHAAILELLRIDHATDKPKWIAASLRPQISEDAAAKSLKLLIDLGYVALDEERGRHFPTEIRVTTGNEVWGLAVSSYHREMINLGIEALDGFLPEQRDIGAITIAIPASRLGEIKDELSAFRKRLLAFAEETGEADAIVQVNLQMFPLAIVERKKK